MLGSACVFNIEKFKTTFFEGQKAVLCKRIFGGREAPFAHVRRGGLGSLPLPGYFVLCRILLVVCAQSHNGPGLLSVGLQLLR